jgi:acetylornithine deacetylase/succinyl-diaminopimelate desuccinylase-like protein
MSSLKKVFSYIDEHKDEHISKIQEFIRHPSVPQEEEGKSVRECGRILAGYLKEIGFKKAEAVEIDGGLPTVYGEYDVGAKKTLLVLSKYDVHTTLGEKWSVPPFEARIVENWYGFPKCMVARGTASSKSQIRAFLNVVEAIKSVDELPVNLMCIFDGEEEVGSPHLEGFCKRYWNRIKEVDALWWPITTQDRSGVVNCMIGSEGLCYWELECSGEYWGRGPTKFDIHGSNKLILDSPAWRMIKALATMVSDDGNDVLIEGWNDKIRQPTKEELELIEKQAEIYDIEGVKRTLGVKAFINNMIDPKEILMRHTFTSDLSIDGIWGGYIGTGTKTVLPYKVNCKLEARLAPGQMAEDIMKLFKAHLEKHGYTDIKITEMQGRNGAISSPNSDIARACVKTCEMFKVKHSISFCPHWPYALFYPIPCVFGGVIGHSALGHTPNEYLVIEGTDKVAGLAGAEKSIAAVLYNFASI